MPLPTPSGVWVMVKGYLLEAEKKHTLAGIFCNIKDMEEGDKESENSKITWCGAVYNSRCTIHSVQFTMHYSQCTIHSV